MRIELIRRLKRAPVRTLFAFRSGFSHARRPRRLGAIGIGGWHAYTRAMKASIRYAFVLAREPFTPIRE